MKNLSNIDIEKIEKLPQKSKVRFESDFDRRSYRWDFPWNKVHRFLVSRTGKKWDEIFSEYVHLEWIPTQYRNQHQMRNMVVFDTFMKEGKIWYYENRGHFVYSTSDKNKGGVNNEHLIEDYNAWRGECFYIHPTTKILCFHKRIPKSDYKKKQSELTAKTFRVLGNYHQLVKVYGTWYEVKGKPTPSDIFEYKGLHYKYIKTCNLVDDNYIKIDGKLAVPVSYGRYRDKSIGPRECMVSGICKNFPYNFDGDSKDYHSIKLTLYRQLNSKQLKKYGLTNDLKGFEKRCEKCGNTLPHYHGTEKFDV